MCNRPFKNATHMEKTLIRNHNKKVSEDDDVFILGDFSIKTKNYRGLYQHIVNKLKGRLHLVMGNHDVKDPWFYNELGFYSIHCPAFKVEDYICVHDPALSQTDRNLKFLCGHVHDLFIFQKNCLNVGADVHNFFPISLPEINQMFSINETIRETV